VLGYDVPPAAGEGRWFYLYLILDVYSRKIVGFEAHDTDTAEDAAHLARHTARAEGIHALPTRPVLHGDNGATLKATTVLAMLHWLGIMPSYSRPRVSDDNAFVEALFRTAKYRPVHPQKGFPDLVHARQWATALSTGIIMSTDIVPSAMSLRHNVMPEAIECCLPSGTRSISELVRGTRGAGAGRPATGRPFLSSRSTQSAPTLSRRRHHQPSFSLRSEDLLPRPDLAILMPRRATKAMGGVEPPAAKRSEHGEHQTFTAVSHVAHSTSKGGATQPADQTLITDSEPQLC
jgi:hypothetical protein